MHTLKRSIVTAGFLIASLAGSGGAWALPLVANGDFETPDVTALSGFEHRTGSALTGWTISSPGHAGIVHFNDDYEGILQPVGGGEQSIQIEFAGDYIEQFISTIPFQNYLLSFALSAYAPPGDSSLDVEIGGFPVLGSPFAGTSASYITYAVPFIAQGAATLIHFESVAIPGIGLTYPHLDDISVTQVPEPASLALAGLALVALGLARRRRNA